MKIAGKEDLLNLGKEIKRLMQKKKQADEHLVELEARIYGLETEYFRETGPYGSIMTGLEGYLGLTAGGPHSSTTPSGLRRSAYREVKDAARIFSNTSASSRRVPLSPCARLTPSRPWGSTQSTPASPGAWRASRSTRS